MNLLGFLVATTLTYALLTRRTRPIWIVVPNPAYEPQWAPNLKLQEPPSWRGARRNPR